MYNKENIKALCKVKNNGNLMQNINKNNEEDNIDEKEDK